MEKPGERSVILKRLALQGLAPLKWGWFFLLTWAFFSAWGVLRPPFQSPDEFAHYIRVQSAPYQPWIGLDSMVTVSAGDLSPLIANGKLHQLPFHAGQRLNRREVWELKNATWPNNSAASQTTEAETSAARYPPLYYDCLYFIGHPLTHLLALSPYDSHYLYRLITALLAALLWVIVYISLDGIGLERPHWPLLLMVVLNPMLAFMSSGINPDAWVYPLVALGMVYALRFLRESRGWGNALMVLSVAPLVKQPALFIQPAIFVIAIIYSIIRWHKGTFTKQYLLGALGLLLLPTAIYYFSFHWFSPPGLAEPAQMPDLPLPDYLSGLAARSSFFFKMYWGYLGWLDYR
jgi:hypothetical protein